MTKIYKTNDLFGNEQALFFKNTPKAQKDLTDYEGFIEKFENKKTTDDCYTPSDVYSVLFEYVNAPYSFQLFYSFCVTKSISPYK
jgi:hypothetical protein